MLTQEQVKNIKWYRQSGAGIPLCIGLAYEACANAMFYYTGFRLPVMGLFMKTPEGFSFYNYFDYSKITKQLDLVLAKFTQDPDFYAGLAHDLQVSRHKIESFGRQMLDSKVGSPEFTQVYGSFLENAWRCWGDSLFLDLYDPFEDKIMDFVFGELKQPLKKQDLTTLTTPDSMTYQQKQQKDLLAVYNKAVVSGLTQDVKVDLQKMSDQYYWLKNDFEVLQYLDEAYFEDQLKQLLSDGDLAKAIKTNLERFVYLLKEKSTLISSLNLSRDVQDRLAFVNWTAELRDERKRCTQISNYYVYQAIVKIAQELNLDLEWLKYALPSELPSVIQGGKQVKQVIDQRYGLGMVMEILEDDSFETASGATAQEYLTIMEGLFQMGDIRGSTGAMGRVTGRAKVVLSQSDFEKFQKGDILIAPMTRPEYVPLMKLASAIVTDEGGITCHAAIVSRELGIPCVIGTQIATKTLKDGDMIEVNANHGIVKIIK